MLILATVGLIGPVAAAEEANARRPAVRGCQPVLPILDASVPAAAGGEPRALCNVIGSPSAWSIYCAANGLACDHFDAAFFDNWTVVAVAIETTSPTICENAGPVPGWAVGCVTLRRTAIVARVAETSAGVECACSMGPQFPIRRHIVQAIPAVEGADVVDCRVWRERHHIECLGP